MKIQVLELPTQYLGEASTTPYALIFSEVPEEEEDDLKEVAKRFYEAHNAPEWVFLTALEVTQ